MGRLLKIVISMVLVSNVAIGDELPKELEALRFKFRVAVERAKNSATKSHIKELETLRDAYTRSNDLQSAGITEKALKGTMEKTAELPDRLANLLERQEKEIRASLEPLRRIYRTELTKLKRRFTESANLEGAVAVDGELAALTNEMGDDSDLPETKTELAAWLTGKEWKVTGGSPGTFHFLGRRKLQRKSPSGAVSFSADYSVLDKNLITYQTPMGSKRKIRFGNDFKSFEHVVEENGSRFRGELVEKPGANR